MPDIKLSDEAFLSILRENAGLFANTAKAIEEKYGINYSRQAVRQRALDHKDVLEDIEDEALDIAEAGMLTLSRSQNEDTKFKACQFILKTKGKRRGYGDSLDMNLSGGITWNEQKTYVSPEGPMETKSGITQKVLHTKGGDVPL